jgi:hypothetical protein
MNRDKWIQQLHDKLAEHEVPAPEDLWADIEAALEQAPLSSPNRETLRKSRREALRRWTAAAAVAALMLGGGYLWWNQPKLEKHTENAIETVAKNASEAISETVAEKKTEAVVRQQLAQLAPQRVENKPEEQEQTTAPIVVPEVDETVEPTTKTERSTVADDSYRTDAAEQTIVREFDRQMVNQQLATKHRHSLTLSLYAMNGFTNENSSNGVLMADAMVRQFEKTYENSYEASARLTEPIYLSGYEERQHHHRPISYGLTVAYPFTKRLSLTTGIVYTKLVSDFTQVMHSQQIQQQQTLHYLGIPISLSYRLWALKGFRAYVSAGTLTYWNVATHLVTEGVTQQLGKDRVQWAFNGSIGVQYDVLSQLGLYIEPGLSYYPDNGSRLQNFFKDKPLNPSLQVGLRVNFGQ